VINRNVPFVAACAALAVAVLLTTASAQAGDKDKRSFMKKSQSSGGTSSLNFSPNSSSSSPMSRKLKFGTSGNGNSGGMSQFQTMNGLSKKKKLGNATTGGLSTGNLSTINGLQSNGKLKFKPQKLNGGITGQNFGGLGNAIQDNTTGIGKFGKLPKDFAELGKGNVAEQIQNGNVLDGNWWGAGDNDDEPPADNGAEPNPGDGPGQGNGNGNGNADDGDVNLPGDLNGPADNDNDCHDNDFHFPWWPIIIGGGYTGGHCHHHHDCYDNYNGGYYNDYSNVTNIVIQETAPTEPALAPGIDLELLDVRLVDAGDPARNLGPRYRLTFGNRGTQTAGNFQVMLMASSDGTPKAGLPMAASEVDSLASRQVVTADVRLPLSAELPTLTRYIVVIDSAAQIGEPDENNNVAILDRDKIILVVQ
jgi:hypothetical protein